ncbi:hypothetical protein KUCAC02_024029, partial [Chaenocephalus aceratus]
LLPVAELSTDICCPSRCPDLCPNVADKEVSVGTGRVRLAALRRPSEPEQGPFPEALFGLASGNGLNLGVEVDGHD